jgi:hypothetical protein
MVLRAAAVIVGILVGSIPIPGNGALSRGGVLAGSNEVTAARSMWMPVTLPRAVRVSTYPFDNPLVEVTSRGSLAGIVLRQDVRQGIEVVHMEGDLCGSACPGQALDGLTVWDPKAKVRRSSITLPRGRYQLYAIATDGPMTARIRLPGLRGSADLAPDRQADFTSRATGTDPSDPYVLAEQVDLSLGHRGLSMFAAEVDAERVAANSFGSCIETSDGELPAATDPAACEGTAAGGAVVRHSTEGGRMAIMSMGQLGPGSYEHQLNFRTASVVRSFEARHFLLEYETEDRSGGGLYSLTGMW